MSSEPEHLSNSLAHLSHTQHPSHPAKSTPHLKSIRPPPNPRDTPLTTSTGAVGALFSQPGVAMMQREALLF